MDSTLLRTLNPPRKEQKQVPKFGAYVEIILEAEDEASAAKKIAEVCATFESFSVSDGPEEIEDDPDSPVEDESEEVKDEEE